MQTARRPTAEGPHRAIPSMTAQSKQRRSQLLQAAAQVEMVGVPALAKLQRSSCGFGANTKKEIWCDCVRYFLKLCSVSTVVHNTLLIMYVRATTLMSCHFFIDERSYFVVSAVIKSLHPVGEARSILQYCECVSEVVAQPLEFWPSSASRTKLDRSEEHTSELHSLMRTS